MRKWMSIGVALLALVSLSAAQEAPAPIKIGVGVAQTSNSALFGQEQLIGARLAEQYFNEQGGINGRPFELVVQDTAGDEATAINAFQALMADEVVAILGPTLSQQAFAADPLAEQAGVPVLAPSNLAQGIPQIGRFITRLSASAAMVAPNAIRTALELDPAIEDVAVFYAQNDAFSSSETTIFQATIGELGLNLATVQTFQTTDTDFSTQISSALTFEPQLVVISGLAVDGGNLVKQLRELGYTGLIVGGNGLSTPNIFSVCQTTCDGLIVAQAYNPSADYPINQDFRALYEAEQGKPPSQFSAQAFSIVQIVVDALRRADALYGLDTLDLAQQRLVVNTLILVGNYETPLGTITFDVVGEVQQASFYVARVAMSADGTAGEFVFIR